MFRWGPAAALTFILAFPGCRGPVSADVPVVTVRTYDFRFEAPDTIAAGWTWVRMVNETETLHHVQIYRMPPGMLISDLEAALPSAEPLPQWLEALGGPEGADDPRLPVQVAVHFEPGEYVLACRFETDGMLHLHKGMLRRLTVLPTASRAQDHSWEAVEDTIWLQDFSFSLPAVVRPGTRDFVVINRGPQEHHVAVGRLLPDAGLKEVLEGYSNPDAPETYQVVGGTAGMAAGSSNVMRLDLQPGRYVLVCFIIDPASGLEHGQLSMVRVFEVAADGVA